MQLIIKTSNSEFIYARIALFIDPPMDLRLHACTHSFCTFLQESHNFAVRKSSLYRMLALALGWQRLRTSGSHTESSNKGKHTSDSSSHLCVTPPLSRHHSPSAACCTAPEGPATCYPGLSSSCPASYTQPASEKHSQRS